MSVLTQDTLRAASLAADAGVSEATMTAWSEREGFPLPVTTICGEPAWDLFAVRAWRSSARPSGTGYARFDEVETGSLVSFPALGRETWEKTGRHQVRIVNGTEVRNVADHERVSLVRLPR